MKFPANSKEVGGKVGKQNSQWRCFYVLFMFFLSIRTPESDTVQHGNQIPVGYLGLLIAQFCFRGLGCTAS